MNCRKCGASLPDNALRCSVCGIKVRMYCPECHSLNEFGAKNCTNCNYELIKICPNCGAHNIYSADKCRKCHTSFNINETEQNANYEFDIVRPFSCSDASQPEIYIHDTPKENDIEKIFNVDIPDFEEIKDLKEEPIINNAVDNDEARQSKTQELLDENIDIDKIEELQPQDKTEEDIIIVKSEQEEKEEEEKTSNSQDFQDNSNQEEKVSEPENETEQETEQEYNIIQKNAVNKITEILNSSLDKHIIAINGEEGSGKTAVINKVSELMSTNGFISLYGSCTPLIQITSFGFFQDAFLRIMGFPPFAKSVDSFIKDFKKSEFANVFSLLNNNELNLFLNIFYPSQKDSFENILENKNLMFSVLEKVIKSLLLHANIIIAIDNFELLDGASYDFIVYLMKKKYFNNRLKLLVAYQENKSIQSYFELTEDDEDIFETIVLNKFNKEEIINAVNQTVNLHLQDIIEEDYLDELIEKSDGNAIRLEQEIALLFASGYVEVSGNEVVINNSKKPQTTPESLEELIKLRINLLSPDIKNVLFMSAIMGYRFASGILTSAVTVPSEKTADILVFLQQELFIKMVDRYTFEFRSLSLWKLIYKEAQADLLYKENAQRLYSVLKPLILSSNLQKLISCTQALKKEEEYSIWQETAGLTSKLGDTNLFIISQKQCLKLIEENVTEDSEEQRSQIYEKIGKLLCEKSPAEAITYLSNVLDAYIKSSDTKKVIDLSGYFVKSCYLTGNYFGASEAVDAVIASIQGALPASDDVDIAMIKTRKLEALFNIGNSEQIINLINEEIIPELNKKLFSPDLPSDYKNLILNAWFCSKSILAKAYALQGNCQVFNVITDLKMFVEKYDYNAEYSNTQISIIEAFANTAAGEIIKSNEILNSVSRKYSNKTMPLNLLSEWNIINIINRVFMEQTTDLKGDLFELAAFTNNINEHFIKNIIKLILGYVINKEKNAMKALEIYNEEITYFAKEKVAIGALLSWALIVDLSMELGDYDKALSTASKSLEIAQSPKINNFFFIIYFQKFLAEIYLKKGDFSAARMYTEKAVMIAKQNDLKYQLIELYLFYGKYLEGFMFAKNNYNQEFIKLTQEMYNKALEMAKNLQLDNLQGRAKKCISEFRTFCQLNSIEM